MGMKFLELPVRFLDMDEEEYDRIKSLGLSDDAFDGYCEEGILYTNPNQIIAYNKDSEGQVNMSLPTMNYKVYMDFDDFVKLLNSK
jgi:hypothetical protein